MLQHPLQVFRGCLCFMCLCVVARVGSKEKNESASSVARARAFVQHTLRSSWLAGVLRDVLLPLLH